MIDVSKEMDFRTARSSGPGGQNVNKVETMVEGLFHVASSVLLTDEQKNRLVYKLSRKMDKAGNLRVRSQEERTQAGNRERVVEKMNHLVHNSLLQKKKRKPTRPTLASKVNRLEKKKQNSERKGQRKKISGYDT